MNWWGALIDYVVQPNETYLFPVAEDELPYYAYVTGYLTNSTLQMFNPQPTTTPKVEPLPTVLVVAFITSVAIIGAGVLVYFKKRNHARINKQSEIEQSST
jgi:multisubunit Na+/H+ antiporter MnhC subunit